ncbi:unnamed protein product [Malus baccata var. baccata]
MWNVTLQSTPLGARRPRRHTSDQGLALIPNCHIPARAPTTSRVRLHRSTILSALGSYHALKILFLGTHTRHSQWHDIVRFGPRPRPHCFVSGNSHKNFPVGHLSWDCSRPNSLNFGVLMEPEASELPKGLVLGRDENIHIRLT